MFPLATPTPPADAQTNKQTNKKTKQKGFTAQFYAAYDEVLPPAPGRERRRDLYQLYHYLNHYNLFGGGYYSTSARLLERLAAQVK